MYIAIVCVVLAFIINFGLNVVYGSVKAQAIRETQQNARFAMEKITRSIRQGLDPLSVFNVSAGVLYENGIALTTDRVRVTDLDFVLIDNSYKVSLEIEHYNPGNRPEYQALVNMESTALSCNP